MRTRRRKIQCLESDLHRRRHGKGCPLSLFFLEFSKLPSRTILRRDPSVNDVIRTLSRIDRMFINIPMAEARDFHCHSHVFENLEKRSIPSDHAAVRVVIQKPIIRGHQGKRIPSWMSKRPVFCSILKRLDDDHQYPAVPLGAPADFKIIPEKAKKRQTVRVLSRKTPDSLGAKLVTASTALRACRNRHLGTLMRCCEA